MSGCSSSCKGTEKLVRAVHCDASPLARCLGLGQQTCRRVPAPQAALGLG